MYQLFISFLLFIASNLTAQTKKIEFIINGKIVPEDSGFIKLRYINAYGERVLDSSYIRNGLFTFRGYVDQPTNASIIGKVVSRSVDDPKFGEIFLESGLINITLNGNNYKEMITQGSITQSEFKRQNEKYNTYEYLAIPVFKKIDSLKKISKNFDSANLSKVNDEIHNLQKKLDPYYDSLRKVDISFIRNNPKSYLSPYMLFYNFYLNEMESDTVKKLFNSLDKTVQNSRVGFLIRKRLGLQKASSINELAPVFTGKTFDNKIFSLKKVNRKKYILLDFWASWCIPCREAMPFLKQIKSKYGKERVEIVAVSIDEDKSEWKKAIFKDKTNNFSQLIAQEVWQNSVRKDIKAIYDIPFIPVTYLIDVNGIIIEKWGGGGKNIEKSINDKLVSIFGF